MKLRFALFFVFLLLVITPIVVFVSWPQSPVLASKIEDASTYQMQHAQDTAASLDRYHQDLLAAFETTLPQLETIPSQELTDRLQALSYRSIRIAAPSTGEIRSGMGDCPTSYTADQTAFFLSTTQDSATSVSSVQQLPENDQVFHIVHRSENQIAVGSVALGFLTDLITGGATSRTTETVIVGSIGQVIDLRTDDLQQNQSSFAGTEIAERLMAGDVGTAQFNSPTFSDDMIAGFAATEAAGWGVIVQRSIQSLRTEAQSIQQQSVYVLLFGALLALAIATLLSVLFTRPLEQAIQHTDQISHGNFVRAQEPEPNRFQPIEFTALQHNVNDMMTRLKHSIESINRLAFLDTTTGLGNRAYLQRYLKSFLSGSQSVDQGSLLFIDLSGFKKLNEDHGHDTGDLVLREAGKRIAQACEITPFAEDDGQLAGKDKPRPDGLIGRLGGDEFIVFVTGKTNAQMALLSQRIIKSLEMPFSVEGANIQIGAQIGAAHFPQDGDTMVDLIQVADEALHHQNPEQTKRSPVSIGVQRKVADADTQLEAELRTAITGGQFTPFFQPQFSAKDFSLVGVEALARWNHPTRGLLKPDEFLPLAEKLKVVSAIDRLMLQESVLAVTDLIDCGVDIPSLSVNISSQRLASEGFVEDVKNLGELPFQLRFEMLESIFIDQISADDFEAIRKLEELGVVIEMDDFGSGHASMMALFNLRPNTIKIDHRLIMNRPSDPQDMGLVLAIIEMSRSMGIKTTVEGVEDRQVAMTLREMGCDKMQGYFFAQPMPAVDLMSFLFDEELPQVGTG